MAESFTIGFFVQSVKRQQLQTVSDKF